MRLLAVWLHVLGVVVWLGGLVYQAHVLWPRTRRGDLRPFVEAAQAARPVAWTAFAVVVLTGFYNVTRLGPLERVMASGAAVILAGKFILVLALLALAGRRDFAHLPRLHRALEAGGDPAGALRTVTWLDRSAIALALVVVYLGLAISRS